MRVVPWLSTRPVPLSVERGTDARTAVDATRLDASGRLVRSGRNRVRANLGHLSAAVGDCHVQAVQVRNEEGGAGASRGRDAVQGAVVVSVHLLHHADGP